MNLISIYQQYPDHEACLERLERARWPLSGECPYCGSEHVARKADGFRKGRWNCHNCKSSFNVLAGTFMQKTKIPLQKWFLAIGIVLNAKKGVSSWQLARDLDLNQKTAWYMVMRIRRNMVTEGPLLSGIVEADEAYIGGKPRKRNRHGDGDDQPRNPRGRGTDKLPIVGAVERGGRVVAEPSHRINAHALSSFLSRHIDPVTSLLVTDEYPAYKPMGRKVRHAVIEHKTRYADGIIHTNTIEGFWSLLKRAWYGTHHHYSRAFAFAYAVEACYKYNIRGMANPFDAFLRSAVAV